ncbi:MAG: hypothetical protein ACR2Q3_00195 [Woeseiaceae bacterium]
MTWNPLALPAIACLILAVFAGALVYVARPEAQENQRLSGLLLIEGVVIFGLHGGQYLLTSQDSVWLLVSIGTVAVSLKPCAYLFFLATLDTPYVLPFRTPIGRGLILLAGAASAAIGLGWSELLVAGLRPAPGGSWEPVPGSMLRPLGLVLSLVYLAAIVFAVTALKHARTEFQRKRMKAYVIAFVTRDVLFVVWATVFHLVPTESPMWRYVFMSIAIMPIVYIPLVGYGILRHQLFGIELHLKETLRHAVTVVPFAVTFFVVTESMEQALPFDSVWLGIAAAGAITLLLHPIRRMAETAANLLFPNVAETQEYRSNRARDVYQATVEAVWSDEVLLQSEERMLARVRQQLGLDEFSARSIENQVKRELGHPSKDSRERAVYPSRVVR